MMKRKSDSEILFLANFLLSLFFDFLANYEIFLMKVQTIRTYKKSNQNKKNNYTLNPFINKIKIKLSYKGRTCLSAKTNKDNYGRCFT